MRKFRKDEIENIIDLSPMQESMLIHYIKSDNRQMYITHFRYKLSGKPDFELFTKAWNLVAEKYASLRSVFVWKKLENPVQIVLKPFWINPGCHILEPVDGKTVLDVCKEYENSKEIKIDEVPYQISIYEINDEYYIFFSMHHILFDGWSNGIVMSELFKIYNQLIRNESILIEKSPSLQEIYNYKKQYQDKESVDFWGKYLSNYIPKNTLPCGNTLKTDESVSDAVISCELKSFKKIQEYCRNNNVSLATIFIAAWGILINKYSREDDIVFGTSVSGRYAPIKNIIDAVGLLINTIPVRMKFSSDRPVKSNLSEMQSFLNDNLNHFDLPLTYILSTSNISGNNKLFDSIIAIENYTIPKFDMDKNDLKIEYSEFDERTNYNLALQVVPGIDICNIFLSYNSSMFGVMIINNILKHYKYILDSIIESDLKDVENIDLIDETERDILTHQYNNTSTEVIDGETIIDLFYKNAREYKDCTAIIDGNERVNFDELNKITNQMARYISDQGVLPGSAVGVMMTRSMKMIQIILAILKAGCAYVPIDPKLPESRKQYIVNDSGINVLLTDELINKIDFSEYSEININIEINSSDPAYIIYTSGTTGMPKGTIIEHKSLVNQLKWKRKFLNIMPDEVFLFKSPLTFDASVMEIFAWVYPAVIAVLEPDGEKDPSIIAKVLNSSKVTILFFTPKMLNLLLDYCQTHKIKELGDIRAILCGGEELSVTLVHKFYEQVENVTLYHIYGPTETTVDVCFYDTRQLNEKSLLVPLGKPMDNVQFYVLDKKLNLLPPYITGDLFISGSCLSRGYLNKPIITNEKFIQNPFSPGHIMYNTGDLAYWDMGGYLYFQGREDTQIKFKGIRVEIEEIKYYILKHPDIIDVHIEVCEYQGTDSLIAYVVSRNNSVTSYLIREFLVQFIPSYIIPSQFIFLDNLPYTAHGKLDTKALKEINEEPANNTVTEIIQDLSEQEQQILEVWRYVLNRNITDPRANFFEAGGDSIKANKVCMIIYKKYDVEISLSSFLKEPYITSLSKYLLSEDKMAQETIVSAIEPDFQKDYYKNRKQIMKNLISIESRQMLRFQNGPYCYEDVTATISNWLEMDYELTFIKMWHFNYAVNITDNSIKLDVQYPEIMPVYLEKYHEISWQKGERKSFWEAIPDIEREICSGRPIVVYFDAYWCPWDPMYKNDGDHHNYHLCIINGVDSEKEIIYFTDPYFNVESRILSYEEYAPGFRGYFYIRTKDTERLDVFRVIHDEAEKLRGTFKENMNLYADKIIEVYENRNRFTTDDFFEFIIEVKEGAMSFVYDTMRYANIAKLIEDNEERNIWEQFRLIYLEAKTINNLLWKITELRNADKLPWVINKFRKLAILNEEVLDNILNKCRIKLFGISNNDCEIHRNTYCIDLLSHFNNKGLGECPENPENKADITGLGAYIIKDKHLEEKYLKTDNLIFKLPDLNNKYDNITCENQVIDVLQLENYIEIHILGCAEYGDNYDEITVDYSDGSIEKLKLIYPDFCDWNNEVPKYREIPVWKGKACEKDRAFDCDSYLYAKKFTLKIGGRINSINLPYHPNLHIFAISMKYK